MIMPADQPEETAFSQADLDEINRCLARMSHIRNTTPDPEMGGLFPDQVAHLLYTEWGQPESAVQLTTNLPLAELESSSFFRHTRALLLAVHEVGGVKMTSSKNLPRRFVSEMLDQLLDEKERDFLTRHTKVLNEQDVQALHIPRVVAQVAGVLRRYKGKFIVSKKAARMLRPDSAGILYRDLFAAFFRRFNLAYRSRYGPDAHPLQKGVPYTLYRLGTVASEWRKLVDLTSEITLPGIRIQVEEELGCSRIWSIDALVTFRILNPLIEWGLLEGRYDRDKYGYETLEAIRVTPLYRSFLSFDLDTKYSPPSAWPQPPQ